MALPNECTSVSFLTATGTFMYVFGPSLTYIVWLTLMLVASHTSPTRNSSSKANCLSQEWSREAQLNEERLSFALKYASDSTAPFRY